jgi:hypothetical protein
MEETNKKVKEMTRKEFCFKLGIFVAIVLLGLADFITLFAKFVH